MLIGEFSSNLITNSRLALPVSFRKILGKEIIITQGYENSLIITDIPKFQALTKDITEGSFLNSNIRDVTRFLIGSAHQIKLDSQGRFTLPQSLKEFSKLKKKVKFVGLLNWVEVWDEEKWLEKKAEISKKSSEISDELERTIKNNEK